MKRKSCVTQHTQVCHATRPSVPYNTPKCAIQHTQMCHTTHPNVPYNTPKCAIQHTQVCYNRPKCVIRHATHQSMSYNTPKCVIKYTQLCHKTPTQVCHTTHLSVSYNTLKWDSLKCQTPVGQTAELQMQDRYLRLHVFFWGVVLKFWVKFVHVTLVIKKWLEQWLILNNLSHYINNNACQI